MLVDQGGETNTGPSRWRAMSASSDSTDNRIDSSSAATTADRGARLPMGSLSQRHPQPADAAVGGVGRRRPDGQLGPGEGLLCGVERRALVVVDPAPGPLGGCRASSTPADQGCMSAWSSLARGRSEADACSNWAPYVRRIGLVLERLDSDPESPRLLG